MIFSAVELEYLRSQPLGRLATLGPDGVLQNSPVGFSVDSETGAIDIGGWNMAASRKFRNVLANSQAAFVVDDLVSADPWTVRGIEIRGTAEALADRPSEGPDSGADVIRIHPARVFSWGVDPESPGMTRKSAG